MEAVNIRKLLGSEMAQDDDNFMNYCIKRKELLSQLHDKQNNLIIINAARGSGKSGLLLILENEIKKYAFRTDKIIKKYYSDILLPVGDVTINQYINFWKNTILGWIVSDIAKESEQVISDRAIAAVEQAALNGNKLKSNISIALDRLQVGSVPIKKFEYDPELTEEQVKRILDKSGKTYWVLFDEMDDHYTNSYSNNNLLLGLLQACKSIVGTFKCIKARVTIRPHIMTILKTQFDITQKFREHDLSISWGPHQLREILVRRIAHYEGKNPNIQQKFELGDTRASKREHIECEIIGKYFQDFDMKFVEGRKTNYRALFTLSFGRPRWLLEFCQIALRISNTDFASIVCMQKAMHEYGNNRIQFIVGEHCFQYPELEKVVNHLAGNRKIRFGPSFNLKNHLISTVIDGIPLNTRGLSKEQYALFIANALYMVEFIRPKEKVGGKNDHRFYVYTDRPELLKSWRPGDKVEWEIHPTFARGLNLDDNRTFRVGSEIRILGERSEEQDLSENN